MLLLAAGLSALSGFFDGRFARAGLSPVHVGLQTALVSTAAVVAVLAGLRLRELIRRLTSGGLGPVMCVGGTFCGQNPPPPHTASTHRRPDERQPRDYGTEAGLPHICPLAAEVIWP